VILTQKYFIFVFATKIRVRCYFLAQYVSVTSSWKYVLYCSAATKFHKRKPSTACNDGRLVVNVRCWVF